MPILFHEPQPARLYEQGGDGSPARIRRLGFCQAARAGRTRRTRRKSEPKASGGRVVLHGLTSGMILAQMLPFVNEPVLRSKVNVPSGGSMEELLYELITSQPGVGGERDFGVHFCLREDDRMRRT